MLFPSPREQSARSPVSLSAFELSSNSYVGRQENICSEHMPPFPIRHLSVRQLYFQSPRNEGPKTMEQSTSARPAAVYPTVRPQNSSNSEANASGISWSAVIAGGFVTAALSLILLALGTGLGLSKVSFWSIVGASASSVGTAAI